MTMIYTFHESGCIPGIPGTFAGCRVEIREDGSMDVQPLPIPVVVLVEPAPESVPVLPFKSQQQQKEA